MSQEGVSSKGLFKSARKVSVKEAYSLNDDRLSLIGVIIGKWYDKVMLEDGTGQIVARIFSNSQFALGDVVLLLGKVASNSSSTFILADIIRKIDPCWLKVRKAELQKPAPLEKNYENTQKQEEINPLEIIKHMDKGEGVLIEDVLKKFESANVQEKIDLLMRNGDIFEIGPGRIKLLE